MKKIITVFSFLICLAIKSNGQDNTPKYLDQEKKINIILRKDNTPIFSEKLIINPLSIDSLRIYNQKITIEKFGESIIAKYGSSVFVFKKDVELLNYKEILDMYKVPLEKRNLTLYIDSVKIMNPSTIYAEKKEIYNLTFFKHKSNNEECISIISQKGDRVFKYYNDPKNKIKD